MPKIKKKLSFMSNELSNKCKLLVTADDKQIISEKLNYTDSYINMVINQKRVNPKIQKALEKIVKSKLEQLTK